MSPERKTDSSEHHIICTLTQRSSVSDVSDSTVSRSYRHT